MDAYPMDEYTLLMEVLEKGEEVKFYIKKVDNMIPEMMMISKDSDEIVLLSIYGDLDLSFIGKLSKSMKIDGLDKLEKIEDDDDMKEY